jgi:predicted DCC family thiol-disulfide oxidoreductase YuxK
MADTRSTNRGSDVSSSSSRTSKMTSDIKSFFVALAAPKSTVFFDGSCPLCKAEIGYYRRTDQAGALCFIDISEPGSAPPEGITLQRAMKRFHVRASDGRVLSGAAAFVAVWARLPRWRWAARTASLPGVLIALELGYRIFLPVRPILSRLFGHVFRLKATIGVGKHR